MSLEINQRRKNKYLLLAEFSVRTVNYGPSFFASIYGPSAKRAGHKSMQKNEDSSRLGDRKQVKDAQFDSHLTGVKKQSLFGARKQYHVTKAFRESKNKFAMLKKFIRSKLRAL